MAKKNRELIDELKTAISMLEASDSLLRVLEQDSVFGNEKAREHLESTNGRMLDEALENVASVHEELLRRGNPSESRVVWNIILTTRELAEKVLDAMLGRIDGFGQVSIYDYYQLVGVTGNFTDEKYGWFDLTKVDIKPSGEGYSLDLPRPVKFDN